VDRGSEKAGVQKRKITKIPENNRVNIGAMESKKNSYMSLFMPSFFIAVFAIYTLPFWFVARNICRSIDETATSISKSVPEKNCPPPKRSTIE
jgi:hypothetical protein